LDPNGADIKLIWDRSSNQFYEQNDIFDYVKLLGTSSIETFGLEKWILNFNLTFNWTYPDEDLQDIHISAISALLPTAWLNVTDFYRVENDLVFNGLLSVTGQNNRIITNNSIVRGGEQLTWTGLTPVYEGTTNIFPPKDEFDISLWDDYNNMWSDSPASGENFTIQTMTPIMTDLVGYNYTLNLTGIPSECDATDESFTIRIDGDNVTFSNPTPDDNIWQTKGKVITGITIDDVGGSEVDETSIEYSLSLNNGTTWSDWLQPSGIDSINNKKVAKAETSLNNGWYNLIKWRSSDSLGNGPASSEAYRIIVDTNNVTFSEFKPFSTEESAIEEVMVSITISDLTSGVDTSSIEYAVSTNKGLEWSSWKIVSGLKNGMSIENKLNLTFPNGTDNRIKWRAKDIAGNGPVESEIFVVKVNTCLQQFLAKIELQAPKNNSIVTTDMIELSWSSITEELEDVTYDILLDTVNPPKHLEKEDYTFTNLVVDKLVNDQTYYWTVIPKTIDGDGFCLSGIWSFIVKVGFPIPKVTLISPENGAIITSLKPTLEWSLDYSGNDIVTFDVYLDAKSNPENMVPGHTTTQFSPSLALENGKTYFWKIIPKTDSIIGPESEIRSFSIEFTEKPTFDLNLTLTPASIELKVGENKTIKAKVKNLATIKDDIALKLNYESTYGINANIIEPKTIEIESNKSHEFQVEISLIEDIDLEEMQITITAKSDKAPDYSQKVEKSEILVVKLLEITELNEGKEAKDSTWLIISAAVVIIIIITILLFFLLFKRKRKGEIEHEPQPASKTEKEIQQQLSGQTQQQSQIKPIVQFQQPQVQPLSQIQQQTQPQHYQQITQQLHQPIQSPQLPIQQNICSTCGQALILIPQNNSYFCQNCQKYE
jgi:hypothetical protein